MLARRDPVSPFWTGLEPEVVPGGLSDEGTLDALCAGADVLIHAAGLIKARSRAAFDAVNREGAAAAAAAAKRAGVRRMVLVSSLAAREPQLSAYAASKRAGERAAFESMAERLAIVRPPVIYGPGDRQTLLLFKAAARSPVLPVFDPRARIAVIHVADAARQIAAIGDFDTTPAVAALSDVRPDGYGWRELMEAARAAAGRQSRLVPLPDEMFTLAGGVGSIARLMGATPMLTLGKGREIHHLDWSVRPAERCGELPTASFNLEAGFLDAYRWYRRAGLL